MKQLKSESLVDYLDEKLSSDERSEVEYMVKHDTNAASDLAYLKLAIETVRLNAIASKVITVCQSLNATSSEQLPTNPVTVRHMFRTGLRIAAVFILLFCSAVLYKYISVSNQSLYKNQFVPYALSNMRGTEDRNPEAEAFRNKNWNQVIELYSNIQVKSNKSIFLAAMSELQLSHYAEAEVLFQNVLKNASEDNSFQEDAEYYSALAYLMNHNEAKGIGMLNKIKSDTNHRYYPLASKISGIDLKIIDLKK
jgi:hypothetical protein